MGVGELLVKRRSIGRPSYVGSLRGLMHEEVSIAARPEAGDEERNAVGRTARCRGKGRTQPRRRLPLVVRRPITSSAEAA